MTYSSSAWPGADSSSESSELASTTSSAGIDRPLSWSAAQASSPSMSSAWASITAMTMSLRVASRSVSSRARRT